MSGSIHIGSSVWLLLAVACTSPGPQGPRGEPGTFSGSITGPAVIVGDASITGNATISGSVQAGGFKSANFGKLVIVQGTVDTISIPWTASEVMANYGATYIWPGFGPHFRDSGLCSGGPNPGSRVDSSPPPDTPGQYIVTFTDCGDPPCIVGSWSGWKLELFDSSEVVIAGPATGRVEFGLTTLNGEWRLDHMSGQVGTTLFACW